MSNLNGIICVNKEKNMASHDVCRRLRKILGTKKVGHTGTLDPMATGVMGVLIGRATKLSEYITASKKEYVAGIKFGFTSDSYDTDEELREVSKPDFTEEELLNVLENFIGEVTQTPPVYSAIKVDGKPLYKYAREGIDVDIPSRKVLIESIELIDTADLPFEAKIKVSCSKGTYIRSLINDIGEALRCGAVMNSLNRTKNGKLNIKDSYTISELEDLKEKDMIMAAIMPEDEYLEDFRRVDVKPISKKIIMNGNILMQKNLITNIAKIDNETDIKIYLDDKFIGTGIRTEIDNNDVIKPKKILYGENI